LKRNRAIQFNSAAREWQIQGLIIGNGWIDAYHQYESHIQFAMKHKLLEGEHLVLEFKSRIICFGCTRNFTGGAIVLPQLCSD
jgi:hypothetical protein